MVVRGETARELRLLRPDGRSGIRLTARALDARAPALSPDGRQVLFVANGDVWVVNTDGTGVRALTATPALEADPAWSPDAHRIAYARGNELLVARSDGRGAARLARAAEPVSGPTWSRGGGAIAFSAGSPGRSQILVVSVATAAVRPLTQNAGVDREPAWSPRGDAIAFVRQAAPDAPPRVHVMKADGTEQRPLLADDAPHASPAWSPDGSQVAFARGTGPSADVAVVATDGTALRIVGPTPGADAEPAWGRLPAAPDRLPDLEQRAPHRLELTRRGGRFRLAFASAVDNIGRGPIWIRGARVDRNSPYMRADQLVRLADGSRRTVEDVGRLRYTHSSTHSHWHFLDYMRYELRDARTFRLVRRDRKTGFCLADHYGHAWGVARGRPVFLSSCGKSAPRLLWVEQGSSVGYTDRYPPSFHGQDIDLTGLPRGDYVLVHRANAGNLIRERSYTNNAASMLLRISWPRGQRREPIVLILAACENSERCV